MGPLSLAISLPTHSLPIALDRDGVVRVGGTRVTLDTIVEAFLDGATAEEIADQYPSLNLADIYSVVGYFLRHREEVETYLEQRRQTREEVRRAHESRFDPAGIRARLLSRRPPKEKHS